jgi:hypothetical protein
MIKPTDSPTFCSMIRRARRMVERLGQVAQVFAHQRHVGGFDVHVGAPPIATPTSAVPAQEGR